MKIPMRTVVVAVVALGMSGCHAAASGNLACKDHASGGNQWRTNVATSEVERCIFSEGNQSLELTFKGGRGESHYIVEIDGFHGVDTYKTTGTPAGTKVRVRGEKNPDGACCTDVSTEGFEGCHPDTCTLEVVNADVTRAAPGSTGRLTLRSTCGNFVGTGVDCVTCQLMPPTQRFDIEKCERGD